MHIAFTDIVRCAKKSDLERLCRTASVSEEDFADFICACNLGLTHLNHEIHCVDFVPPEVEKRVDDWQILHADPASKQGQNAARRLFKTHGQRQYKVGHMFFSKKNSPTLEWHFVFFDMKETRSKNNHWKKGGAHVHFVNYLCVNLDYQNIWADFISNQKFPNGSLHLRYIRSQGKVHL